MCSNNYNKEVEFMNIVLKKAKNDRLISNIKKHLNNISNEIIVMIKYCNLSISNDFFKNEEDSKKLHFNSSVRRFKSLEMLEYFQRSPIICIIIFGPEEDYINIIKNCPKYDQEINRTILWKLSYDSEEYKNFLNLIYDIVNFSPFVPKPAKR
jgi:hypothetical protein